MPTGPIESAKPDFGFVKEDVQNQREVAEDLLKQIEEIDRRLAETGDDAAKSTLQALRSALLNSAKRLAENANTTSTRAANTIVKVSSSSIL